MNMGMDFLDITFRAERALEIKISLGNFSRCFDVHVSEVTVGQLHQFLVQQVAEQHANRRGRLFFWCNRCGSRLYKSPENGYCRVCGISANLDSQVWAKLVRIFVEAGDVNPKKVKPNSKLVKDLGIT